MSLLISVEMQKCTLLNNNINSQYSAAECIRTEISQISGVHVHLHGLKKVEFRYGTKMMCQ